MKVVSMNLGSLARAVAVGVLFMTALVACRGNPQAEPQASQLAASDDDRPASGEATRLASVDTKSGALSYPAAPRRAHVDRYHGEAVDDPYRWLEDLDATPTRAWIDAQNRLAQPYLERAPTHSWFRKRLTQLWNYERYGVPVKEGDRYFWLRNDGLQNQSVLYVADSLDAASRPLLDPNRLSKDATISLSDFEVSPDGKLLAYSLSDGGTDWDTWHVRDVATGKDLADVLRYTKFTSVSWERDSKGFYYSRYPEVGGKGDDSKQVSIYRHRIGEPQSSDRHSYSVTDHPTRNPYGVLTEDGRFLVIDLFDSYAVNGVYYVQMETASGTGGGGSMQAATAAGAPKVVRLLDEWKAQYSFLGNRGSELFFLSTDSAPRGRVIAIDTANPQRERWREVVPQAADVLDTAHYIGGSFVLSYLHDAHAQVKVVDESGKAKPDIVLPGLGKVDGFTGSPADPETFFSYTDYLTPAAIYRYDVATQKLDAFRRPRVEANTNVYLTEQVFYRSKDGTRVPMFITRRKDFVKNGTAPVLLYGYGGFNSAQIPAFSASVLAWLEAGGVYAVANLRGGSEYGEEWHEAGTKLKKQNVFDDFIAAAEHLIAERYTSKQRIAALGRSNGGLLVAAVITQRPDLFAAALPAVGVLDMLRYHTASANARQWSSDYGLSENADEYRALRAYSPYHNVKSGACYPPTLVTTADHDDRVVPWHSFKFAAALQAAQSCGNPVLIRIETRAGHGAGKPVWMQIEDIANQWAFLTQHLRMDPQASSAAVASGRK